MLGNTQRTAGRHPRRGWTLAAGLLGLTLAVAGTAAFASARTAGAHGPAVVPANLSSTIRHDKAYVSAKNHGCTSFATKCPLLVATTPSGSGGNLIAVEIRQSTMDDCNRGLVYLFDGTKFIETTHSLRPFSVGGVDVVHAHGTASFAVTYWVSRSKFTSCAANGNAGTDVYTYRWNGSTFHRTSGTLPKAPKVIVGSPQDN
jgi:hypothetical protein